MRRHSFGWTSLATLALVMGAARSVMADETGTNAAAPEVPKNESDKDKRIADLEKKVDDLKDEVSSLKDDQKFTEERVKTLMPLKGKISGYLDFGFFWVAGDGTGLRKDIGHQAFPDWADPTSGARGKKLVPDSWVFMGDPLATAINSRGEPADTGESRAVTFDPIKNGGKASFIVNALSFALFEGIGDNLQLDAVFDLVPRGRDVSDPNGKFLGDFVDVKLAFAEYRIPWKRAALSLYAGKFESVLGIEYRTQEAVDRIGVSPSLICRYTCGRPLGLKARFKLLDDEDRDTLVIAAAVTNGSSFIEGFPFKDEIDHNSMKTGSARISYRLSLPGGGRGLELGVSGAYGAQDLQTENGTIQWHLGGDAHLEWGDLDLRGEYVKGHAEGRTESADSPCDLAPCIEYQGAYGQLAYRVSNGYMPYYRVDWRDALHQSGQSFVYISRLMRMTTGMHFEIGTNVIIKGEYTHIRWLGGIPQFPAHVATSSMVVKF